MCKHRTHTWGFSSIYRKREVKQILCKQSSHSPHPNVKTVFASDKGCFSTENVQEQKRKWEEELRALQGHWMDFQFSSVAQLCPTLCDPRPASRQTSLSITNFWSLLKLMSIQSVMLKKEFIGPVLHLRPVHADQAQPPLQWTLNSVFQFSSVQLLSRVWLFATPWIAARQASLSITNSVFSAYENNNRRIRPPPDRGTLKTVSRLVIT